MAAQAPTTQYTSVLRRIQSIESYIPVNDFLQEYFDAGWELITVVWIEGILQPGFIEVFYLKAKTTP